MRILPRCCFDQSSVKIIAPCQRQRQFALQVRLGALRKESIYKPFFSNASITNQLILINFYFGLRFVVLYAAGDLKKYENKFSKTTQFIFPYI